MEERRGDCSLGVQESEVARISGVDDAVVCSIWTHKFTTTQSVWLHFSLTVFISLDTRVEWAEEWVESMERFCQVSYGEEKEGPEIV